MPSYQEIEDFAAKLPPELREEFKRLMAQPTRASWENPLGFRHMPLTGHIADKPFTPKHIPPLKVKAMKVGDVIRLKPHEKKEPKP